MVVGVDQLPSDPQFQAREFFVDVAHPVAGNLVYPGAPFKLSASQWKVGRAPVIGEHNRDIYCDMLGYTNQDLAKFSEAGVI